MSIQTGEYETIVPERRGPPGEASAVRQKRLTEPAGETEVVVPYEQTERLYVFRNVDASFIVQSSFVKLLDKL